MTWQDGGAIHRRWTTAFHFPSEKSQCFQCFPGKKLDNKRTTNCWIFRNSLHPPKNYVIIKVSKNTVFQCFFGRFSEGRLAQLVEHPLDVREVTGSSPVSSTRKSRCFREKTAVFCCFFHCFFLTLFCQIIFDHITATDRKNRRPPELLFQRAVFCSQQAFSLARRGSSSFFISRISSASFCSHSSSVGA